MKEGEGNLVHPTACKLNFDFNVCKATLLKFYFANMELNICLHRAIIFNTYI